MFQIQKKKYTNPNPKLKFSILIPSWNNLDYLKLCVRSIKENSHFQHQIIVVVNEGKDGTIEWVKEQKLDYVYAEQNIGICYGLNSCRSLIETSYVLYMNDDMYALPLWDKFLFETITSLNHSYFMCSSTMIEPTDTGNPCVVVRDYGDDINLFQESKLLAEFHHLTKDNWVGSSWPPNIMHIDTWDLVGGMSIEYSPGFYSDPDLTRKLWQIGVRDFIGVGQSKVYHFGSKSTRKIKRNVGKSLFLHKWGVTPNFFYKKQLNIGGDRPIEIDNTSEAKLIHFFKKLKSIF